MLRSEFVDLLGGHSAILPLIRRLAKPMTNGYFDLVAPEEDGISPCDQAARRGFGTGATDPRLAQHAAQAITDVHSTSPLIAPASPADAIWLARALAELIDAMETEDRDWSDLDKLQTGEHSLWWQLTAEFLKIAVPSGRAAGRN